MKCVVVYESLWGNTAAVAHAVAGGIGPEARCLSTAEATEAQVAGADLIVAGAPLLGFSLPTEDMRRNIETGPRKHPAPPDVSAPSMRSWLASMPHGSGRAAAFETRLRFSPGGATGTILKGLDRAGYRALSTGKRFLVSGAYGPLRDGELDRAREWGTELADAMR